MKKILIVEDDEAIRTELITLLRANGYLSVDAPPCELILMDVNLPGMKAGNAVELTKNEARILGCLMQKDLCTREELIEDLWTNGMYIDGNTLYVNIGRLREKLSQIGADVRMQKATLLRQTGVFFLMPFAFPLLMTVPMGVTFGKIYEIWNFQGLSGQKAMETAVLIALVIAGVYAIYFLVTYCISCDHVICYGTEGGSKDGHSL